MLWEADDDGKSKWPMPTFYAERMMMDDWGAPSDQPHGLYVANATLNDADGRPYVVAYPLVSPAGRWTVMLVNRDQFHAHRTPIAFQGGAVASTLGAGRALDVVQYSRAQYGWRAKGEASYPTRDLPPARFKLEAGQAVLLPAMSLTVVGDDRPAP
jgi:hypothetical protein